MRFPGGCQVSKTLVFTFLLGAGVGIAQSNPGEANSAQQLVQQVIENELASNRNDHTKWMFRDADKTPDKDTVKLVVETADGNVSKTMLMNGRPLTAEERSQDEAKMEKVVNDPAVRARQRRNTAHDDQQAVSLMKMLPERVYLDKGGGVERRGDSEVQAEPGFSAADLRLAGVRCDGGRDGRRSGAEASEGAEWNADPAGGVRLGFSGQDGAGRHVPDRTLRDCAP